MGGAGGGPGGGLLPDGGGDDPPPPPQAVKPTSSANTQAAVVCAIRIFESFIAPPRSASIRDLPPPQKVTLAVSAKRRSKVNQAFW